MAPMPKRLPDELFRGAGDPGPAQVDDQSRPGARETSRPRLPFRSPSLKLVAPPMVVAGVVGALLLGFIVGRFVVARPQTAIPAVLVSSFTSTPTALPSPETTLVPWSGPVQPIEILDAQGSCQDTISLEPPANLLDDDPTSVWRCRGAGVGETITFTLQPGQEVVGVRLVNGYAVSQERYLDERRILSVKWTFSDGSWVVQGFAANDRQAQELRFPPTPSGGEVTMTVLDATVPGAADKTKDAVSISALEFLGVA